MKRQGQHLEQENKKLILTQECQRQEQPLDFENEKLILTQESHKLKLNGLTKYNVKKDIEKFLKSHSISFVKVKKSPTWNYCLISFNDLSDLKVAQEALPKLEYKNNKLFVSLVEQPQRQFKEREIIDDGIPPHEKISGQVTPLWRLSYREH